MAQLPSEEERTRGRLLLSVHAALAKAGNEADVHAAAAWACRQAAGEGALEILARMPAPPKPVIEEARTLAEHPAQGLSSPMALGLLAAWNDAREDRIHTMLADFPGKNSREVAMALLIAEAATPEVVQALAQEEKVAVTLNQRVNLRVVARLLSPAKK